MSTLSIAVRNGWLVDGSGAPRRKADVGIAGDRIVRVGTVPAADLEIDAAGLIVAPGFVDPHSHSDWSLHSNREAESVIRQGVTTEVVGNCGITNAPVSESSAPTVASRLRAYAYDGQVSWRSFGEYMDDVEQGGTARNLAFLVGHSTLREAAGVSGSAATADQISMLGDLLREALEAGALGMSSGLEYGAGAGASTMELQALVDIVGRYGGIYASHIRNRDAGILDAVGEFIDLVQHGNAAGQISHLNVRHDTNAPEHGWERAVDLMVSAREQGFDIQADATPFRQGLGVMTGLLPSWVLAEGSAAAATMLRNRDVRDRLRADCDRYWRFVAKGQWDRVRLGNSREFADLNGLTFVEIAKLRDQDSWDAYFDLMSAAGDAMGDLLMVGDLFTEEHLAQTIAHPLFSLGVDAFASVDHGPLGEISANPLCYRGHVEYLAHHVREKRTLKLEEAIRKMSSMPARRFALSGRGLVREGYFADLVLFDAEAVRSASTFARAAVYPEGISVVVVNGVVAVQDGRRCGTRSGRLLRRPRG